MASLFDRVAPDCRDLAVEIEALLVQRRQEAVQRQPSRHEQMAEDWWPKEWTRDEICDVVYSSYKAFLKGTIRRPPRRQVVMELADYLQCSLEERNRLLLAARYAPEQLYLTGSALEDALSVAAEVIASLSLPAHALTRDWDIHLPNDQLLTLLGISHALFNELPGSLNGLQLLFDPQSPLHARLHPDVATWDLTVRRELYSFKLHNQLCQYDAWYSERVKALMALPRFAEYWQQVQVDASLYGDGRQRVNFPDFVITIQGPDEQPLALRLLLIALGDFDFPKVIAYAPTDEHSRRIYARFGLHSA